MLGYIPGHIHAFWLIYKNAQAEERYGEGQYKYTGNGEYRSSNLSLSFENARADPSSAEPIHAHSHAVAPQQPPAYGATQ